MPRGRARRYSESVDSPQITTTASVAVVAVAERSNRLLAIDTIERAQAQGVDAKYELSIVGPLCDSHWRKARKRLEAMIEKAQAAIAFVDLALEPFGAELQAEREKILTRRH